MKKAINNDENKIAKPIFLDKKNIKYICLPLLDPNNREIKLLFDVGAKVLCGSRYGYVDEPYMPHFCSVSGTIVKIEQIYSYQLRRSVPHVVVENDYLYNKIETAKIISIRDSSKNILEAINESGVSPYFGEDSLYLKYRNVDKKENLLIINCYEELIEKDIFMKIIHVIKKISGIKRIYILGDKKISSLIEETSISVISKIEDIKDLVYLQEDALTLLNLAEILFHKNRQYQITVRVIGDAINSENEFICPIGTPFNSLIETCGGYREEMINLVINDPLANKAHLRDEFPLDEKVKIVYVLKYLQRETSDCYNCGLCIKHCPVYLQPIAINRSLRDRKVELIKHYHADECIECGLCSYYCPAKIDLMASIKKAKNLLKIKQMKQNLKNGGLKHD